MLYRVGGLDCGALQLGRDPRELGTVQLQGGIGTDARSSVQQP